MLNPEQSAAVEAGDGPVLVLGSPGCGKSAVIISRVAHLLNKGVRPSQILVVTFTTKAAEELVTRLANMLGTKAHRIWASTFHAACLRILRQEAHNLGYPDTFWITDGDDSVRILRHAAEEAGYDTDVIDFKAVASAISWYKNAGVMPDEVEGEVGALYALYQKSLLANSLMDYDDLLLNTVRIFGDEKVLKKWQKKFKHILIDEYNDTNVVQYVVATLLSGEHHNLFVVGDADQSIFGWRGADITNILNFKDNFPDAKLFKLEQNYRSTKRIVDVVNRVASGTGELSKKLWTANPDGEEIIIRQFYDEADEAFFIVDEIVRQNFRLSDTAVLARTRNALRTIERTMLANEVPCKIIGQVAFGQRREIKDVLSYLKLIMNPNDDEAFLRVINTPRRGLGNSMIQKLIQYKNDNNISLYRSCKCVDTNTKTHNLINEFCNMIDALQQLPLTPMILKDICERSGYLEHLEYTEEWERRANVKLLLDLARDDRKRPMREFLDYLMLLDETESDPDRISLMTIHASKGLEFENVFVVGLNEETLPHYLAIQDGSIDEEQRLFYVSACT